ncbi:malonyl-ACP O-methyltransferase BioC [Reinekea blandensis]|uniref:Malonyl-[acyl-carrier protein] O-methyltransferase n=1 Tax=Reinekea blandensis MED297 TaxID=314283 RepID=A4BGD7_9GAMM|nr:malonyl-ACP O-methyltransferase BioC [Reinekea blandensis]EAR08743.1 biotin synthesis protein BioC [Reinekea sp. MED297] [Reinekea blandensis MED297]
MNKQAIAQCFSRAAAQYDQFAHLQRTVANRMLAGLPGLAVPSAPIIADLGTGTGYCLPWLQRHYQPATLYGVDLSETMLARARQRTPQITTMLADLEQPPFANDHLDLAVSSLAVQWLASPNPFISRMAAALAPGGHLVLATLGPKTLYELKQAWALVDEGDHVNRFHSAVDWLDAIWASDLSLTLWREERLEVRYDSPLELLRELKALGANHVERRQGQRTSNRIKPMLSAYDGFKRPDGRYPATWEVFYIIASKV